MSGMLFAIDMACVRMMSTKPATSSAVLFACTRITVTLAPAIRHTHQLHVKTLTEPSASKFQLFLCTVLITCSWS